MPQDLANKLRIEPATLDDLPALVDMLMELFALEADFEPDREKQQTGLRLVLIVISLAVLRQFCETV